MKNALVVYYSRTGHSRLIARETARKLKADLDEIKTHVRYKGFIGFYRACLHAITKKEPVIEYNRYPGKYDLVIIVGPNWGSRMASPIQTYLSKHKLGNKKIGAICVQGSSGGEKIIALMEKKIRRKMIHLIINQRDIKDKSYVHRINEFLKKVK
ncbi:hypothetical protein J4218_00220 [Candidatus Pacearchaeota archaeon]|nr:hypothetical protein [Candidatus Pacearchaeota archaeon]